MNEDFTARPAVALAPTGEHRLALRFVGSGSEYFRIWIVNLLLTLLTLGLYYPYAKRRRLRYFFGSTEVGGHPLSFHADPGRMFLGYLLVAGLVGAYALAGQFSPRAGLVTFVILAGLWPALWHSSLRFRLANTGWRGLRLSFTGRRSGAYQALAPALVLAALVLLIGLFAQTDPREPMPQMNWANALALAFPLLTLAALPALFWLLRRYQHDHYVLGRECTRFSVPVAAFYGLAFRAMMLSGLAALLAAIAFALLIFSGAQLEVSNDPEQRDAMTWRGSLTVLLTLAALHVTVRPYFVARMQNLVWNGTHSQQLRFESSLRFRSLLALTLKNWALMTLTLGLYFPFASVATARLRQQAVTLVATRDPDSLLSDAAR